MESNLVEPESPGSADEETQPSRPLSPSQNLSSSTVARRSEPQESTEDGDASDDTSELASHRSLKEIQHVQMIQWCVSHKADYIDKNFARSRFWSDLRSFCAQELGVDIKNPDRVLGNLVKKHKISCQEIDNGSGIAIQPTDLSQALDEWVQVLDDLATYKADQKAEKSAKKSRQQRQHDEIRVNMLTRIRERSASTPKRESTPSESVEDESDDVNRRKRRKRDKDDGNTVTNSGLESAARIFSSGLKEALQVDRSGNEALKTELQSVKQTMAEILDVLRGGASSGSGQAEQRTD